ncbi:MAG: hypothetical protein EON90_03490 [Brevundimonas sp.]|nr:MAG: hypothetical protein EON90_03490 [Brevundimonas sp.]
MRTSLKLRLAAAAMIPCSLISPPTAAQVAPSTPPAASTEPDAGQVRARPDINPYDRDIEMTAPLQFNQRILGELPVLLTRDDQLIIESAGFRQLIDPLLTPEAQAELRVALELLESFSPEQIHEIGIRLEYDPAQLAVMVLRVDPSKRSVQNMFQSSQREEPALPPDEITAYLNTSMALSKRSDSDDVTAPSVFLNGAIRFGSVVFEADVQGQEDFNTGRYRGERQYARLVYDQPEQFRRFTMGDLDLETRGRQGFVQLGGVGIQRQRRRFDSFRNNVLSGNRQLLLQENATVRVLRNGVFQREFVLDAGQYDISSLPLETGSNDIQLEIVGESGQLDTVSYSAYLDAIDLEPGDYEYAGYFGLVSDNRFGSPVYDDGDLAFSGYWRKAFLSAPAIGVGVQASESVQTISGQTQYILNNGARIRLDGAGSNADFGTGYAFAIGYEYFVDRGVQADSWTVVADFTSEDFATLGNDDGTNPTSWIFSGTYGRRLSERWSASLVGSYRMSRNPVLGDSFSVNAVSNYRISQQWSAQAGIEYVDLGRPGGSRSDGVGLNFTLVWQPSYDRRVEGRYNSARNSGSVRYRKMTENRAGAYGYSLATTYDDGAGSASGQLDYIGNRFNASMSYGTFGNDFSSIGDRQITTLRMGSSIAAAGKHWGVGRNIYDSFAVVYPHESLPSPVIVGDNLEGGAYVARSGLLGGAVANNLISYVNQAVRYDAVNAPPGYDTGAGVTRVFPSYRSGYAIEVGRADYVSAVGRLVDRNRQPVPLLSGRVLSKDDPNAKPALFFTNTGGRFAVQNLTPGRTYIVELPSEGLKFEISVPADSDGLLDLQQVTLPIEVTGND